MREASPHTSTPHVCALYVALTGTKGSYSVTLPVAWLPTSLHFHLPFLILAPHFEPNPPRSLSAMCVTPVTMLPF